MMSMLRTARDLMLLFFSRKADSAFLGGGAAMVGTAVVVDAPATSGDAVTAGSAGAALIGTPTAMPGGMATAWRRGTAAGAALIDAPTAMPEGMATAGRRGAALVDEPPVILGAMATAWRRGASADVPTATLGAGETEARRDASLVFDASATRCRDPRLQDAIELDGLGEGGDGGGRSDSFNGPVNGKFGRRRETMILFECPGMIGPLDTATLAGRRIIPFSIFRWKNTLRLKSRHI